MPSLLSSPLACYNKTVKRLLLLFSLSLVATIVWTAGCTGVEDVTAQEAFTLIQDNRDNPDFVILDVRTPEEFADGHLESAINIDYNADTFRDELDNLDKNKTYLIYCRSGNRSGQALALMEKLNFREVYNISDGIIGWQAEKLPTTK